MAKLLGRMCSFDQDEFNISCPSVVSIPLDCISAVSRKQVCTECNMHV